MARARRKATSAMRRARVRDSRIVRPSGEIIGIVTIGVAVLLGIGLAAPLHMGFWGAWISRGFGAAFGSAAWLVPIVVALLGAIVFLEIDVPRMMATLGLASLGFFLVVDAAYASRGGAVGGALDRALRAVFGEIGAPIVLIIAALGLTIGVTRISLKHVIGRAVAFGMRVREYLQEHAPERSAATPALPKPKPALPAALVEEEVDAYDESDDDEYEDDEDEDEDVADEDEDDEEDEEPDDGQAVAGEYEPPALVATSTPPSGPRSYRLPDLSLFDPPQAHVVDESSRAHTLEDTLASFGVGAKVVHIERGPSITRYELRPDRGVKIARIASLADDLALALAATAVRIEAPIPGKSAVGIEVPNATVSIVAVSEILHALPQRGSIPPLNVALGKDITGRPVFGDLGRMPHLLVAGATGSGKSVLLNVIIASLLASATPDQVQLLMIDPKRVELNVYNGIPHLIKEVITDARMAAGALAEMTREMDERYERFAKAGARKIEEYNAKFPEERLPYVVIVIDELADLMMIAPAKVEQTICRLAQLARATGIHLVVATQRPSVDVITGIIKANIPSRLSFAVSSQVDSRTILDMAGAERLLGRGDMLYLPIDAPKPIRAQGALITSSEINRLVAFWAAQARPENLVDVDVTPIEDDDERRSVDPLAYEAAKFIIESNYASTAQLQSRFAIGHPRAVRIMKQLEDIGIVGPHEGTKPRRINIGLIELEQIATRLDKSTQLELVGE